MIDRRQFLIRGLTLGLVQRRRTIFADDFESASLCRWSNLATPELHVQITMSTTTVNTLLASGLALFGFRVVRGTEHQARPLVWRREASYGAMQTVTLPPVSGAYTAQQPIVVQQQIQPGFRAQVDLGNTLVVDQASGTGVVASGGSPGAISIRNDTATGFTTGLLVGPAGPTTAPICAYPLFGGFLDVITPVDKVLLMFSTLSWAPGTVIESLASVEPNVKAQVAVTTSPGVLIDLTGVTNRSVTFDLDTGWTVAPWAQTVSSSANLVPLLIEND